MPKRRGPLRLLPLAALFFTLSAGYISWCALAPIGNSTSAPAFAVARDIWQLSVVGRRGPAAQLSSSASSSYNVVRRVKWQTRVHGLASVLPKAMNAKPFLGYARAGTFWQFFLKACNLSAALINVGLSGKFGTATTIVKGEEVNSQMVLTQAYDHIAMPLGPAFGLWGLIFLWTLTFAGVQAFTPMFDVLLPAITPWFCAAQLMQALWVPLFTSSDPELQGLGGDFWLWLSNALLISTAPVLLAACASLSSLPPGGAAYWISYGIAVNAAWVLLAAGLAVNISARALGLQGRPLSVVAFAVLGVTVVSKLRITGFFRTRPMAPATAFFPVGMWALFWIYRNLQRMPATESGHAKRILPLYGSRALVLFKQCAVILQFVFMALQVLILSRQSS